MGTTIHLYCSYSTVDWPNAGCCYRPNQAAGNHHIPAVRRRNKDLPQWKNDAHLLWTYSKGCFPFQPHRGGIRGDEKVPYPCAAESAFSIDKLCATELTPYVHKCHLMTPTCVPTLKNGTPSHLRRGFAERFSQKRHANCSALSCG